MRQRRPGPARVLGAVLALPGGVLALASGSVLFSPDFNTPDCGMCAFLHLFAVPFFVAGLALLVLALVLFLVAAPGREEGAEAAAGPLGEDRQSGNLR